MKISFWHHTADQQPNKDGLYLTYRGWGMGGKTDGDQDHGYLYYRKKDDTWYEYEGAWRSSFPETVSFVYYWTDADPVGWVEKDPPVSMRKLSKQEMHIAEKEALADLEQAIERYETIRTLCAKQS